MPRLLLATAVLYIGCSAERSPRGKTVERVVTLTPSATEVVYAAGGLSKLVGVDSFSTYPPEISGLPVVGDFLNPSPEEILRLSPDLVILDAVQARIAASLESAGVPTLVLTMHTVGDIRDGIRKVSRALETEEIGAAAIERIDKAIARARENARARSAKPKVLLVIDRRVGALGNIVAAGSGTYLDELLAIVGAKNVLSDASARYPKLAAEDVIAAAPEIILDSTHTDDSARALRDWQGLAVPAVRAGRVHALEGDVYLSPSPRVSEVVGTLESVIYGR